MSWICWYCQYENRESDDVCQNEYCRYGMKDANRDRAVFAKLFPDDDMPFYLSEVRKRIEKAQR